MVGHAGKVERGTAVVWFLVVAAAIGMALIMASCAGQAGQSGSASDQMEANDEPQLSEEELREQQVQAQLEDMTLEQKVAQMFIVTPESITDVGVAVQAGSATREAIAQNPVGGLIYFTANLEDPDQARSLLSNTRQFYIEETGIVPFLCVDEEGGSVARVADSTGFDVELVGDMRTIGESGDTERAKQAAVTIGTYLSDVGFNVDFAPVADIASSSSSTMYSRSFGATAEEVSPMVEAQIEGFGETGILCAAKHFPGIGDAEGDSHEASIVSYKTADEMAESELVPFETAIEADVPFIMVGHLSVPNIATDGMPASLSSDVMTGLLREKMGFEGVIITDSLGMGAATDALDSDHLALAAISAGADIALMPVDYQASYQVVLDAVKSGEISEQRIDDSVKRILRLKMELAEEDRSAR